MQEMQLMYVHKRTGVKYRAICEAFDVERQRPTVIYMSVEGDNQGAIFSRDREHFMMNFYHYSAPQANIIPKDTNQHEMSV